MMAFVLNQVFMLGFINVFDISIAMKGLIAVSQKRNEHTLVNIESLLSLKSSLEAILIIRTKTQLKMTKNLSIYDKLEDTKYASVEVLEQSPCLQDKSNKPLFQARRKGVGRGTPTENFTNKWCQHKRQD